MMAGDALLVAEVSDTTLAYDRDVKLPRYAASGIPEVWIEDLQDSILLVYRNPINGAYTTVLSLTRQDSVSVQAFPDVVFKVADLIG
jgi:Uma2 family endonuclease